MSSPIKNARRPRGSAIVLVLFMLLFMVVMGLVYLTNSRNEKNSSAANRRRDSGDDTVQTTVSLIGTQLTNDVVNNFLNPTTSPVPYYDYITYPNARHPWLAAVDGYKDNQYTTKNFTGAFNHWTQISRLYPNDPFVLKNDPFNAKNSGDSSVTANRDKQIPVAIQINPITGVANPIDIANAELQGWTQTKPGPDHTLLDARYQLLHVTSADGTVWLIALHIDDNSGLVNVNTATQITNRATTDVVTGHDPSDIDFYGMLTRYANVGTLAAPNYLDPTTFNNNWNLAPSGTSPGGFIQSRGLTGTAQIDTRAESISAVPPYGRQQLWTAFGSNLQNIYNSGGPWFWKNGYPSFYCFGPSDEVILRSDASSASTKSFLQLAINGYSASANDPLSTPSPRLDNSAPRRYITTYNAVRLIGTTQAANASDPYVAPYRMPMPPWIDNLDSSISPLKSPQGPSANNPIPSYKLNPNPVANGGDAPNDVRDLMVTILGQQVYDDTIPPALPVQTYYEYNTSDPSYQSFGITPLFAYQSAYWLDANLRLYTNNPNNIAATDTTDITNYSVTPSTNPKAELPGVTDPSTIFYPAGVQPFLTEAVSIRTAGDPTAATPTPDQIALIVEIRNPFLSDATHIRDIDLTQYSLKIDGVDYPLTGTLHAINPANGDGMTTNVKYCYSDDPASLTDPTKVGTGDPNVKLFLQSATGVGLSAAQVDPTNAASQVCVLSKLTTQVTQSPPAPAPPTTQPTLDILLVYHSPNGGTVVVDRLRPPQLIQPLPPPAPAIPITYKAWPAAEATPIAPATTVAPGTITSASIQRDCGYYAFAGTTVPTAAMPNYVFESHNGINAVVVNNGINNPPLVVTSATNAPLPNNPGSPPGSFTNTNVPNALTFTASASGHVIPSWKRGKIPFSTPEFRILPPKGAPLDSIGELTNLLTVGHVYSHPLPGPDVDDPVSVNLYYRLQAMAIDPKQSPFLPQFARLRVNEFCSVTEPRIPVACMLLDALDLLPANNTNPVISGKINIETAPQPVWRAMPFLGDPNILSSGFTGNATLTSTGLNSDNKNYNVPVGLVAYRDRLTDVNASPASYDYSTSANGQSPATRYPFTGIPNLRSTSAALPDATTNRDYGFVSPSEVLCARPAGNNVTAAYYSLQSQATGIDIVGRDTDPTNIYYPGEKTNGPANPALNSGPIDTNYPNLSPPGSQVLGDTVKRNALFTTMANNLDVRGDVFTAYVKLVGVRQINGVWTEVATRHFAVVYDRTNVQTTSDSPKVLMFVEW